MARLHPRHSVLISCTQPRADWIVNDLRSYDVSAVAQPALCVKYINNPLPDNRDRPYDAMLITSRNTLGDNLPDNIPVIAVGEETARQAENNGLSVIMTGGNNLQSMDLSPFKNILYPCAETPSLIPPNATPWIIYKTFENPDFTISKTVDTIAVFSVKGAQIVRRHSGHDQQIICLSQTIADMFDGHPIDNLAVCKWPRYDDIRNLIIKRYREL